MCYARRSRTFNDNLLSITFTRIFRRHSNYIHITVAVVVDHNSALPRTSSRELFSKNKAFSLESVWANGHVLWVKIERFQSHQRWTCVVCTHIIRDYLFHEYSHRLSTHVLCSLKTPVVRRIRFLIRMFVAPCARVEFAKREVRDRQIPPYAKRIRRVRSVRDYVETNL